MRSAIVGSGFIADFHLRGIIHDVAAELVAVCDTNLVRAEALASGQGAKAYQSLDQMLAEQQIDVVHILTPPDTHHALAEKVLQAGSHVFVEKPMCASTSETSDLLETAAEAGLKIGVNHNLTFLSSFERLRQHVHSGALGPIDYLSITHLSELPVMRMGPFNNWIVREPGNALMEIGSHLVSELLDLAGEPDRMSVIADRPLDIPGGGTAYRRWRVAGDVGSTAIDLTMNFGPGFPQRTIMVRGLLGTGLCDLNANTCVIDRRTSSGLDFDRRARTLDQGRQLRKQASSNIANVLFAKAKLPRTGTPDQISIQNSIASFYAEVRETSPADRRLEGQTGHRVIKLCEEIIAKAGVSTATAPAEARPTATINPKVLVIGGTGFIGKALVRKLLESGHEVRIAARSPNSAMEQQGGGKVEIVRADMSSADDLSRALEGIDYVFHLATTDSKTWPQFLEREVEPARVLGEICLKQGVKRLVYTGTIDSLYAGPGAGTISDSTPVDPSIGRRNYYARAKAAGEEVLLQLHRTKGLPVVVVRPGIVIGQGGNPFHWGVGRWTSEGVVELWGDGDNKLPLVLVDDVASGLVKAMEAPGIEGRSYNLVDRPLLSARDYISELERIGGFKVEIHPRPVWRYYLEDMAKWPIKVAVRHADAQRIPSYRDWASRTQKASFDAAASRKDLGWQPVGTADELIERGIAGSLSGWLSARS
ncbi:nucleoside-diphosphate-sugar epimerase/predicted dehydrogenase [Sphingomonas kaistensis]|uniref:Nucleoside-diphosphate-sugar epimerase/predicted dehydrogenase n=1 Tax=Sphingomonas kaistensis TaxID=298708 RepID=A0A7X6BFJ0_9SPHN|nr:NAD-dependent epimerase/dehydratase family protein [Sphingomonas kaistensis]NJC04505.1 nucleoside-diphosphate-sugar epimerase/predicted dehydrogenase [Sphingomonas kaistensis]